MPFVAGLLLVVQIGFVIHAIRSGREQFWVYIIAFLPGIGCAAYFFTQILPELNQNQSVNKAGSNLLKAVDPQRELNKRKQELERADTIDNRRKLAAECVEAGMPDEGIELLSGCFKGGFEDDPHLLLELATACFAAGQFDRTRTTLELLIEKNPSFKSHDGHLLYARSLENTSATEEALKEYSALANSFPGEEARVRYGLLLKTLGRNSEAQKWFNESITRASRAPGYYRKKEKEWLRIARENKTGR